MKDWDNFFDSKGTVIHTPGAIADDGDGTESGGGDAINRTGHYYFLLWCHDLLFHGVVVSGSAQMPTTILRQKMQDQLLLNWDDNEKCICRYWKAYPNSTDADWGVGRDQFMPPTITALLLDCAWAKLLLGYVERRNGLLPNIHPEKSDWNGDALWPDNWASLYRAAREDKPLKILAGDLFRFLAIAIRIIKSGIKNEKNGLYDDVGDSINLTQELMLFKLLAPGLMSTIQCWLFGFLVYGGVQYQWDVYFAPPHAPPFDELARPVIGYVFPRPYKERPRPSSDT